MERGLGVVPSGTGYSATAAVAWLGFCLLLVLRFVHDCAVECA